MSARIVAACALVFFFVLTQGACRRDASPNTNGAANANASNSGATANAAPPAPGGTLNTSKLDAEIARLEKEAERNPGDGETLNALSQAYASRAGALQQTQQLREALRDYRSALRNNPDNEEAQQRVAEISKQLEGEGTGENGEPAPLPITPNVTTGDDGQTDNPSPSPTPARKKKP
ncbi:MAG TPA: hypothetical protein VNA19_09565 [Pyrinomonadaceae bacterium]|nr:hypothetical protein [Pyrinomonadaceae bacterium]